MINDVSSFPFLCSWSFSFHSLKSKTFFTMTIRIPVFVANVTFFNLLILNYLIHLIDWDLFYQYNKFYELSPQVLIIENLYFLFIKKKKKIMHGSSIKMEFIESHTLVSTIINWKIPKKKDYWYQHWSLKICSLAQKNLKNPIENKQ